jgi:hypothetical protein
LTPGSIFKADFLVFSNVINIKCVIIIAKFKLASHNSAIESDLVNSGKQMKDILNDLVLRRVPSPKVYGLLCQGESLLTYVMDIQSPQIYIIVGLANITLRRKVEELKLLPILISTLIEVNSFTLALKNNLFFYVE